MADAPAELLLSNISSELLRAVSGNNDDELIKLLREKAETIGQNKKKLLELEDWLMKMISQSSATDGPLFGKMLYPEISQYAHNIKSSVDLANWSQFIIYSGKDWQEKTPTIGLKTSNKNECIIDDSLNNVIDYQVNGSSPEILATQINNKIARFQNMFMKFAKKANKDFQITPVHESTSNDLCVYGRIWCESEDQINEHNVLIEGDFNNSKGRMAQIRNIENMPCICLFPGQMVAVKGNAIQDDFSFRYIASNIYTGIPAERPLIHGSKEVSLMYGEENVHIMVVRSLLLTDKGKVDFNGIFKKIKDEAPHVVIFMGPFVSARIVSFQSQNFKELGDLISIYFMFIEELNTLTRHSNLENTKYVLVPHSYDLCSTHPLPQPPLNSSSTALGDLKMSDKIICIPNPGYLKINEIIVGITSCDPISSISKNMVCKPEDKALNFICQQLIQQRSFFPNYPSSKLPSEYAVEINKLRHLEFPFQYLPHLYLFPSNYKKDPFVEVVSERCFVSVFSQSLDSWSDSQTSSVSSIFISPPKGVDKGGEDVQLLLSDRLLVTSDLFVK